MLGAAGFVLPEAFNRSGAICGPEAVWFKVKVCLFLSDVTLSLYVQKFCCGDFPLQFHRCVLYQMFTCCCEDFLCSFIDVFVLDDHMLSMNVDKGWSKLCGCI
jgi:hypothetical protein